MNILILSPFPPYPLDQGGKIRIFNIIRQLSRSHTITLACLSPIAAADYGPLQEYCDEIVVAEIKQCVGLDLVKFLFGSEPFNCLRYGSPAFAAKLRELLSRKSFDLVQVEFTMMWQYAYLFKGIPVVLDAHNIEYHNIRQIGSSSTSLLRKALYRLEEKRLRTVEERAWQECALCCAVSDPEREEIAAFTADPSKVVAAPNGVDPVHFAFRPREKDGCKVLFLGGMDYYPNLDAARWFLDEIFPLIRRDNREARLLMVGRDLSRLGEPPAGVEFHENVPEVLLWFHEADCLAVPLRLGAGTRLKILEAMASGLPVVTTGKGCEGIAVTHGEQLLVADTREDFASGVLHLLGSEETGKRLAASARSFVLGKYTWEKTVALMEERFSRLAQQTTEIVQQ